jgi:hypothetical protein
MTPVPPAATALAPGPGVTYPYPVTPHRYRYEPKTSHFPPITTARNVPASHSSAQSLGLSVLFRAVGDAGVRDVRPADDGSGGGQWHLELTVGTRDVVTPSPTPEDLLVIYLAAPVSEDTVARAVAHGGTVAPAENPYWDVGGVTIADPDSYRVVLT